MDIIVGEERCSRQEVANNNDSSNRSLVVPVIPHIGMQATVEPPAVGMIFEDIDDLYEFYKKYARSMGFGIAKRGVRKDDNTGQHKYQTIMCTKGRVHKSRGINLLSQRPSGRDGCKARVCCSKNDSVWIVSRVVLEHNREVNPSEARFHKQHQVIDLHIKRQVEANDAAGIRPFQNIKSIIYQAGGHEEVSCLSRDLRNHVSKVRRLQISGGDAETVHQTFAKWRTESRDFFYLIKPDKQGKMKHMFWADARCRAAYEEFGDVITFDTTYLVNKYDMPCAAFVGVNHHNQSILLGCALVNNEKTKTFIWLFETWLRCMGGRHPEAILTDQCGAISSAISAVFPNSRHRWCIWHLLCKFPVKLAKNSNFHEVRDVFMAVVFDSITCADFEESWRVMVSTFHLESNKWLKNLYETRERWVPVYLNSFFWAGMSSTQRSESIHAFFKGYVNSRTTLTQFVNQYELAIRDKIEKEVQEDFLSTHSHIPCVTRWPFELQLCRAYTNNMFKLVQKEIVDIMYCDLKEIMVEGSKITYEVSEIITILGTKTKSVNFVVNFDNVTLEVNCQCHLFEFQGILCSHAFKVFGSKHIDVIPDRYILRRWRKDVGRAHSKIKVCKTSSSIEVQRTKQLEKIFYSTIDIAMEDQDKFDYLMNALKEHYDHIERWVETSQTVQGGHENDAGDNVGNSLARPSDHAVTEQNVKYQDPLSVRRRGRPKSRRRVSMMERAPVRRPVTRSQMRGLDNRLDTVPGATTSILLQQTTEGHIGQQGASTSSIWPSNELSQVGLVMYPHFPIVMPSTHAVLYGPANGLEATSLTSLPVHNYSFLDNYFGPSQYGGYSATFPFNSN